MMIRKTDTQFNCKILVAEDYPVNQELIREMLEIMGCTVDVAADGAEALDFYRKNHYDLIMMDLQMPEKDGYLVTEEIRLAEKGSNRTIPIIALTASTFDDTKDRCLQVGMNDFISKPLRLSELEDVLKKHLG